MNESEWQKIRNLNADDMIQKLVTPVYQIKYIEIIGYVFILEEDLIMADGTKQTRYFLHHVFDNTDDAKSGIIKEYKKSKRNNSDELNKIMLDLSEYKYMKDYYDSMKIDVIVLCAISWAFNLEMLCYIFIYSTFFVAKFNLKR